MLKQILACFAVVAVALVACSDSRPKLVKTKAARVEQAEAAVSVTPVPRTYAINGNQIVVLEVPLHDGVGHLDSQRCFIWRDAEYKTASLQCPPDQVEPVSGGPTGDSVNH